MPSMHNSLLTKYSSQILVVLMQEEKELCLQTMLVISSF